MGKLAIIDFYLQPFRQIFQTMIAKKKRIAVIGDCRLFLILYNHILNKFLMFKRQYPCMMDTLETFNLLRPGVPTLENIQSRLDERILTAVRMLKKPTLLLVPPVSRQQIIDAVDAYQQKIPGHSETYVCEDVEVGHDLWDGGKSEKRLRWEVSVVSGAKDILPAKKIKGDNPDRAKAWVEKYQSRELDIINDVRTYMTLVMRGIASNQPIDQKYLTMLNAKNIREGRGVACGNWSYGRVHLDVAPSYGNNELLRARGLVRVI